MEQTSSMIVQGSLVIVPILFIYVVLSGIDSWVNNKKCERN